MDAFVESYKHTDLGAIDQAWFEAPEFFAPYSVHREHPQEFVIRPT